MNRTVRHAMAAGALALVATLVLTSCWTENQAKIVTLVNATRKAQAKPAVAGEQKAMNKAQAWAQHMADTGVVEHTGGGAKLDPSGIPKWCAYAENVAMGTSIQSIYDTWMRSSVHRGNILGNFNKVGTGVVRKGDKVYAVIILYRSC